MIVYWLSGFKSGADPYRLQEESATVATPSVAVPSRRRRHHVMRRDEDCTGSPGGDAPDFGRNHKALTAREIPRYAGGGERPGDLRQSVPADLCRSANPQLGRSDEWRTVPCPRQGPSRHGAISARLSG